MESEKKIIMIDASSMKKSHCGLRFYHTVVTGYRSPIVSNDITFGSAFHLYRKIWEETHDSKLAAVAASEYFASTPAFAKKNKQHLTDRYLKKTITEYHLAWDNNESWETVVVNGTPLVELKFCLPYYIDEHVEVLICGTMDAIVRSRNNPSLYAIKDYKTTSAWDVKKYFESYKLNPQLIFYVYTLQQLASIDHDIEGLPISNNFAKEITGANSTLGAFIDGIFLGGDTKDSRFERSELFLYNAEDINEFSVILQETVGKLISHVTSGVLPRREGITNGTCEGIFGACEYAIGCGAPSREIGEMILNNNMMKKEYNPLLFG